MAERLDIHYHGVKLVIVDIAFGKGGHGPQTMSDLEPDYETRKRLIVQGRTDPGFTIGMALVAFRHEYLLPERELRRSDCRGSFKRRFPVGRTAAGCQNAAKDQQWLSNSSHLFSLFIPSAGIKPAKCRGFAVPVKQNPPLPPFP